jgi:hypothetical protein
MESGTLRREAHPRAAFNGQHGGQARPASELAGFKIGTLAQ